MADGNVPDGAVTVPEARAVFAVLARLCGAAPADEESFVAAQASRFVPEYRFCGSLGFGGKVYRTDARGRWRVACYREDETPARLAAIAAANEALAALAALPPG